MAISTIDYIGGVFTTLPLVIGYTMALLSLQAYFKKRSTLVLLSAFLFAALCSPWLGSTWIFLTHVFDTAEPTDRQYVFSYAWSVPVFATIWIYISTALFQTRKSLKYFALLFYLVLDVLYLKSIYIDEDYDVVAIEDSIFKDSTFTGISSTLATLFAVSVLLIVPPTYFWVSKKADDPLFKFRSRNIGIGSLLFVIAAATDGIVGVGNIAGLVIIRLMISISLFFLYVGYNTPQRIRNRYS